MSRCPAAAVHNLQQSMMLESFSSSFSVEIRWIVMFHKTCFQSTTVHDAGELFHSTAAFQLNLVGLSCFTKSGET
jgi:hypothetical protein